MTENPDESSTPPAENLEVSGQARQPIELPIAQGPATGYSWQLQLPPGVRRIDDGAARPSPPSTALGGASGAALRVEAIAGEHVVQARLARPWEPDRAIRRVRIIVRVS